jgi:hypothetical protein
MRAYSHIITETAAAVLPVDGSDAATRQGEASCPDGPLPADTISRILVSGYPDFNPLTRDEQTKWAGSVLSDPFATPYRVVVAARVIEAFCPPNQPALLHVAHKAKADAKAQMKRYEDLMEKRGAILVPPLGLYRASIILTLMSYALAVAVIVLFTRLVG